MDMSPVVIGSECDFPPGWKRAHFVSLCITGFVASLGVPITIRLSRRASALARISAHVGIVRCCPIFAAKERHFFNGQYLKGGILHDMNVSSFVADACLVRAVNNREVCL
jgi:hypothetical protein